MVSRAAGRIDSEDTRKTRVLAHDEMHGTIKTVREVRPSDGRDKRTTGRVSLSPTPLAGRKKYRCRNTAADRIDTDDRRKTPVVWSDAVSRLLPEESTTIAFNDSDFPTVT